MSPCDPSSCPRFHFCFYLKYFYAPPITIDTINQAITHFGFSL